MTDLSRRTLLKAVPLGAATVGMSGMGLYSAAPAHAAIGMPEDAIHTGLTYRLNWAGFNKPRTLLTYRMPDDPMTVARSRLFAGEWSSVADIKREKPSVYYSGMKTSNFVRVTNPYGDTHGYFDRDTHENDHRRLLDIDPINLPVGARQVNDARTFGARWVRYREYSRDGNGRYWYHCTWHDNRLNRWRTRDFLETSTEWDQFESGFNRLQRSNIIAGAEISVTATGLAWAGNILFSSGLKVGVSVASGGFGVTMIAGMMLYGAYEAYQLRRQAAEYFERAFYSM